MKRAVAKPLSLVLLAAIIFSLGGCTKCGFIWDQSRAYHTDKTR